jgi:hypothetical protein
VTTIHPFADNPGNATPQKRAEETKSLPLLQRTLPQAADGGRSAAHTTGERPPSTLVAVPVM